MRNKKGTLINIFAALIFLCVQMFISFWMSPFVIRKLGEEAYGFINLANNFVAYASLLSVAVNSMACRYISVEYNSNRIDEAKKYFCTVFFANCVLYGLILIISIILVGNLQTIINISSTYIKQVKFTFLLSFVNMGASMIGTVYTAAAFSTNKMHYNSLIQIISNVIKAIVVFGLYTLLPPKIYFLSIAMLIAGVVTLSGNYLITKSLFEDFDVNIKMIDISKLIKLTKSGVWVLVSNVSNLLLNGLDLLLSNWFISTSLMGRLSLAKQIPFALSNALGVFSNIFSAELTKNYAVDGYDSLVEEANNQIRILTIFFTVPYAGIIAYGIPFLNLWLNNTKYSSEQIYEIYILMILILIDIIVSTYMYSIHSVFIALDKVKVYSIVLLAASFISIVTTLFLLKTTSLGAYAIAGTSTLILGITHGIVVPGIAAKLLCKPVALFWKTEMKSWGMLGLTTLLFLLIGRVQNFSTWIMFFLNIVVVGVIGYIVSFFGVLKKTERQEVSRLIERMFKGIKRN